MNDNPRAESAESSLTQARWLDQVCNQFEQAWREGPRPCIEDFLAGLQPAQRSALLRELILLDIYYRREHGEMPRVEDYGQRFPDLDTAWRAAAVAAPPKVEAALPQTGPWPGPNPASAGPLAAAGEGAAPSPAVGTSFPRLEGYELLEELGRGGMGVVYKARQTNPPRLVALKVILSAGEASAEELERFQREAEIAAQLDHPHLVAVYQAGVHEGLPYLSMQLVEGGSLSKQVSRFIHDPWAAARLMATVARAIHYSHQHGILHRDLKPGNILLDPLGEPHVADFGLAKRLQGGGRGLTQTGAVIGTPAYMAPEQAAAPKGLTTAVDVYGLGAVLYELLTGRAPFQAATHLDTLLQVLDQEPVRPRALNPRVDRDLEAICLKCLEKRPARRYGSAEALAEDLERWVRGEPIRARQLRLAGRLVKWVKRRPLTASLLAVALWIPLVSLGFAVWQWQRVEAHRRRLDERFPAQKQRAMDQIQQPGSGLAAP
jgi:serine/threonine-protein kinase